MKLKSFFFSVLWVLRTSQLLYWAVSWSEMIVGTENQSLHPGGAACAGGRPSGWPSVGRFESSGDSWCHTSVCNCDVAFLRLLQFSRIITEHHQMPSVVTSCGEYSALCTQLWCGMNPQACTFSQEQRWGEARTLRKNWERRWKVELFQLVEPGLRAKLYQCLSGWRPEWL